MRYILGLFLLCACSKQDSEMDQLSESVFRDGKGHGISIKIEPIDEKKN